MGWEPWTGCYAASEGCKYCYYYGTFSKRHGQNEVVKTDAFSKPIETVYMPRKKITKYKMEGGKTVDTCFTTDFFLPEADPWRREAWQMMKARSDLHFLFLTKRIERFEASLPDDWGDGYDNVTIGCTVENQQMADARLPLFLAYPIKHRVIACSPLLSKIDLSAYLQGGVSSIQNVTVAGEAGREARVCDYEWVLDIRAQCEKAGIPFSFRATGSRFCQAGVVSTINPKLQHRTAREMNINIGIAP